jgi:hypothetical protein
MPQNVKVSFTPENSWNFIGNDPAHVMAKDDVTYHREPGNAPWRFTGATITPPHAQFQIDVHDNKVTIRDDYLAEGTFCVVLKVRHDNGTAYDSPDPQIINEPSKGFPGLRVAIGLVIGAIVGALIDMNTGSLESRGPLKGLIVGAIVGAIVGWMMARRKKP